MRENLKARLNVITLAFEKAMAYFSFFNEITKDMVEKLERDYETRNLESCNLRCEDSNETFVLSLRWCYFQLFIPFRRDLRMADIFHRL